MIRLFGLLLINLDRFIARIEALFNNLRTRAILKYYYIHLIDVKIRGPFKFIPRGKVNMKIGKGTVLLGGDRYCVSSSNPNKFALWDNSELIIGQNCGISATSIACKFKVTIGNNVKIGSGCILHDSDHHSLDPTDRKNSGKDRENAKTGQLVIEDNVFIGANSTILKDVCIGKNSVIAASSVVTKSIPSNQLWGGVPARFIRDLSRD
jgi:acetyltransferase-like isoleucine patch superfamily enzyme